MHLTGGRERAVAVVDVSPGSASVAVLSVSGHSPANIIATGHSKLTLEERTFKQATAQIGGRYILGIMHRYARAKGFRIRAPATTRRQAAGHTVTFPAV